jgi:hypothetical protein
MLWSWRAIVRPKEWEQIRAFATSIEEGGIRLAEENRRWRASRRSVADEYRAEAARLRARAGSDADQRRAAEYEHFANATIQNAEDYAKHLERHHAAQGLLLAAYRRIDTYDTSMLVFACLISMLPFSVTLHRWRPYVSSAMNDTDAMYARSG